MRQVLALVALLGLDADAAVAAAVADDRTKKFAGGYDFLKQQKYHEARTAFEAALQQHPENAGAHFGLAEACRGLKAWSCAEEHYETSVELDAKSTVASLATQRGRKAKVWRLLEEGKLAINEPNASPTRIAEAEDTLDLAKRLGLDQEQRVVYQQLQGKIQQKQKLNHEKTVSVLPEEASMALVPEGEFLMGSVTGEADEQPVHRVYLNAYLLDKYHVSVGQYAKFLDSTSRERPPDWNIMNRPYHQKRPVVNVSWADADAYCRWTGKRLPTEAEWEKAARGTDGRTYPWGDEFPTRFHANSMNQDWRNHGALTPVGLLEGGKSPYGVYDMAGNVWEWVNDWYDQDYYKTSPRQNPTGPSKGVFKVIRGGSWGSSVDALRSSERETHTPSYQGLGTGFRCAKTL